MRNALSEIPVLLCCIWGGLAAGGAAFLLRLPRRLVSASFIGRPPGTLLTLALALADMLAAAAVVCGFALTLLHANGGEPRLFAVCGFAAGALASSRALKAALGLK